jgi:hydrogenase-4 component F
MLLPLIILVPLTAGLLCLVVRSRTASEWLNLLAFIIVAALATTLATDIVKHGTVTALNGFLRADALSALTILLISFVALGCGIYAIGYFRQDERVGRVTAVQLRHYYALTPLLVSMMLLVPLADSLGPLPRCSW